MNYFFSLLARSSRRIVRSFLLVPLLVGSLFAQTETGSINGRVYGEASGKALQGAVVSVGTASDYTDDQGRFSLSSIPAGTTTLEVEYVGLDPITRTVQVPPGGTVNVVVSMTSEVLQL